MKTILIAITILAFSLNGFSQSQDSIKKTPITLRGASKLTGQTEPLIILNGEKQELRGLSSISSIPDENVESINIWKNSAAVEKYGPEGFAGVIEIKTKSRSVITPNKTGLNNKPNVNIYRKDSKLHIRPVMPANTDTGVKNSLSLKSTDAADVIYIVDGKEVANISGINDKDIESVSVLKSPVDSAKYNLKGKSGVVIIATKKAKSSKDKN